MSSRSETEEPSGHKNTFTEDDTSMLSQHSEYVTELLDERARLGKPEQPFKHLPRLIEAEINRFLGSLTTESSRTEKLPKRIMLQEKLIVPVDKYPKYNFEPLNVIVQCEDYEDVCRKKLEYAIDKVNVLLNPPPEGKDELKRKQLIDLSIINGTYRPTVATKPHSGSHNRSHLSSPADSYHYSPRGRLEREPPLLDLQKLLNLLSPKSTNGQSQEDNKDYYNVHFPGWGKRYDDVFSEEQVADSWKPYTREAADEAREAVRLAKALEQKKKRSKSLGSKSITRARGKSVTPRSKVTNSEVRSNPPKRSEAVVVKVKEEQQSEPEELKPFAMELRFPKALGQILVDDHDLVDRRGQLPTYPAKHPVDEILKEYLSSIGKLRDGVLEREKPVLGEDEDLVEPLVYLRFFFDCCLGTSLLYKTERSHYDALHLKDPLDPKYNASQDALPSKSYGLPHLLRLLAFMSRKYQEIPMSQGEIERIARSHQGFLDWLETKEGDYFDRSAYFVPLDENLDQERKEHLFSLESANQLRDDEKQKFERELAKLRQENEQIKAATVEVSFEENSPNTNMGASFVTEDEQSGRSYAEYLELQTVNADLNSRCLEAEELIVNLKAELRTCEEQLQALQAAHDDKLFKMNTLNIELEKLKEEKEELTSSQAASSACSYFDPAGGDSIFSELTNDHSHLEQTVRSLQEQLVETCQENTKLKAECEEVLRLRDESTTTLLPKTGDDNSSLTVVAAPIGGTYVGGMFGVAVGMLLVFAFLLYCLCLRPVRFVIDAVHLNSLYNKHQLI
ncbi:unnamed protein product, partial [Mesorhabditis spiculigera]